MPSFEPLGRGWNAQFIDLVRSAEHELLVCSPYVSERGTELLVANLSQSLRNNGRLTLLTDLSPVSACDGATDPFAISRLTSGLTNVSVVHLPRLHAKVYVADSRRAIVTSGNLTAGGLFHNYEYGVASRDVECVTAIVKDLEGYANLGGVIDHGTLDRYCVLVDTARAALRRQDAEIDRSTKEEALRLIGDVRDELIRTRLSRGPLSNIFAQTILYLLNREGPLSTETLHPMVQHIHPDLCDDSVDRVIDGRRFGKKWKHAVRTAQQHLKSREQITLLTDGRWVLTGSAR
jgi:hypothetical protein